jgi:hypothetical protein
MTAPKGLVPAERDEPDPVQGWRGAELTEDELVDDDYIAQDPTSFVVDPERSLDGS